MKIFISTDMEGIEGISSWNEMDNVSQGANCTSLLKQELNWIIDEIFRLEKEEKTFSIEEICICDSHSRGENLVYGSFGDKRITHIKGYPRPFYMMEGLDASFDLVFLIGYHASIGSKNGMMDHSYSASCIYNIRLNGRNVGEVEINAYFAGLFGVPIALVSGDDILEKQLQDFFKVPYVRTKEGLGRFSGKMYSPELLQQTFQQQVQKSLRNRNNLEIKHISEPILLEVDLSSTVVADAVSIVPGITRISGRTISYHSKDYSDIFRMILTIAMVGGRFAQYS
ncbi:M55 family metallopeptidase [uncultured Sphaerochaeta sp.]|uniref:M55 family metallopeptidase n=1 Tax=uncultured Sphaerochaeta sp. TaxID=886478 RepID=UPI002A0A50C0|nr:M55 family metallopeptidase [uncultured Sphaerochaeta sp.]